MKAPLLSLLIVCSAIATAAAQTAPPAQPAGDAQAKARAQTFLTEGTAAYGRGDYATALDKFTAAYKIFPSPKLWFNIGQANRDLGRPVEAVAAFDRFLREAGQAPPETLSEARRSAAELKTKLGQIKVTCPTDGADVSVDGKPIGSTPLGELVWTTPGRHQVAVQRTGFSPAIEDVVVTAGKAASVTLALRPIDLRLANPASGGTTPIGGAPGAPQKKPIYRRPWFWIAAGVVVAAGAGTAAILATRESGGGGGLKTTLGVQQAY
jgi:hypothetical protein